MKHELNIKTSYQERQRDRPCEVSATCNLLQGANSVKEKSLEDEETVEL